MVAERGPVRLWPLLSLLGMSGQFLRGRFWCRCRIQCGPGVLFSEGLCPGAEASGFVLVLKRLLQLLSYRCTLKWCEATLLWLHVTVRTFPIMPTFTWIPPGPAASGTWLQAGSHCCWAQLWRMNVMLDPADHSGLREHQPWRGAELREQQPSSDGLLPVNHSGAPPAFPGCACASTRLEMSRSRVTFSLCFDRRRFLSSVPIHSGPVGCIPPSVADTGHRPPTPPCALASCPG